MTAKIFKLIPILFGISCQTVSDTQSRVLVSNGKHIRHTEFPASIALYQQSGDVFCTATAVATNAALTAAHCVENLEKPPFIIVGSQDYEPEKIAFVNPWTPHKDLAVLIFSRSLFLDFVRIAAEDPDIGSSAMIIGYGCDGIFGGAGLKKIGTTSIESLHEEGDFTSISAQLNYDVRAHDPGASSGACPGDSGGALQIGGTLIGVTSTGGENRIQQSQWTSLGSKGAKGVISSFHALGAKIPNVVEEIPQDLEVRDYQQEAAERRQQRRSAVENLLEKRRIEDSQVVDRNAEQESQVERLRFEDALSQVLPETFESAVPEICEKIGGFPTENRQILVAYSNTRIDMAGGPIWLSELQERSISGNLYIKLRANCDGFFSTVLFLTQGNDELVNGVRRGDSRIVAQLLSETGYHLVIRPYVRFSANINLRDIRSSVDELAVEIVGDGFTERLVLRD